MSVLQHAVDAVKGWHRRLCMRVPLDGPGEYRSLMNSLRRFQPVPWILKFPIHKFAVRRLLTVSLPPHPPCAGVKLDLPPPLVQLSGCGRGHAHMLPLPGAGPAPDV